MDRVVWSAARRLAVLVSVALASVAIPFVADARIRTLPALAGGLALALFVASLAPLRRAGQMIRASERPGDLPPAGLAYRASARAPDHDPDERAATHHAANAFLLLAVAGALVVVAAASR